MDLMLNPALQWTCPRGSLGPKVKKTSWTSWTNQLEWLKGRFIVWVKMNNTGKWLFYHHFWPFFANCMVIFHKTEVQTVILMCLMGLNSNWFKGYYTKSKYFHFRFLAILYKNTHLYFLYFCVLCHNFWTN